MTTYVHSHCWYERYGMAAIFSCFPGSHHTTPLLASSQASVCVSTSADSDYSFHLTTHQGVLVRLGWVDHFSTLWWLVVSVSACRRVITVQGYYYILLCAIFCLESLAFTVTIIVLFVLRFNIIVWGFLCSYTYLVTLQSHRDCLVVKCCDRTVL